MSRHLLGELERRQKRISDKRGSQVKEPREVGPKVLEIAGHVCGRKALEYSHPHSLLLDPNLLPHAPHTHPHPQPPPSGTVTHGHGFLLSQPALLIFELDCRSMDKMGIPE